MKENNRKNETRRLFYTAEIVPDGDLEISYWQPTRISYKENPLKAWRLNCNSWAITISICTQSWHRMMITSWLPIPLNDLSIPDCDDRHYFSRKKSCLTVSRAVNTIVFWYLGREKYNLLSYYYWLIKDSLVLL